MRLNKDNSKVYCDMCNLWIDPRGDVWLEGNTVHCIFCDATLGYTWDCKELYGEE